MNTDPCKPRNHACYFHAPFSILSTIAERKKSQEEEEMGKDKRGLKSDKSKKYTMTVSDVLSI